jgi:hypothetical protein
MQVANAQKILGEGSVELSKLRASRFQTRHVVFETERDLTGANSRLKYSHLGCSHDQDLESEFMFCLGER